MFKIAHNGVNNVQTELLGITGGIKHLDELTLIPLNDGKVLEHAIHGKGSNSSLGTILITEAVERLAERGMSAIRIEVKILPQQASEEGSEMHRVQAQESRICRPSNRPCLRRVP